MGKTFIACLLQRAAILPIIFLLGNCTAKLGFVDISPRTTPVSEKVNRKLYVFIGDVKDNVVMERGAARKLEVTQFRTSVKNALMKSFQNSFKEIVFTDRLVQGELLLHIYRIEPYWKITRSQDVTVSNQNGTSTRTVNYSRAVFQFQATLFNKGVELSRADNLVWSREEMPIGNMFKRKKLFTDGLTAAVEAIHESIVITGNTWKTIE